MEKYCGVGSRETPHEVMVAMTAIAKLLSKREYILRSGGANGADTAFENGATYKEIFLPWARFNKNMSTLYPASPEAHELASTIHPKWGSLPQSHRDLHARNCHQVLGHNLDDPVKFLACWTPAGQTIGGTATAIRIAKRHNVPIFNFANYVIDDIYIKFEDFLFRVDTLFN